MMALLETPLSSLHLPSSSTAQQSKGNASIGQPVRRRHDRSQGIVNPFLLSLTAD
jgi:hypothetical protein